MAKIYTSRFSNKELESGNYTVVGIVRSMPRYPVKYKIAGNIKEIAPPRLLWNENDKEKFKSLYIEHLENIGLKKIEEIISQYLESEKNVVLCCYEDVRIPEDWCHRIMFAEWIRTNLGWDIKELINPMTPKIKKVVQQKQQQENNDKQLNLFDICNA